MLISFLVVLGEASGSSLLVLGFGQLFANNWDLSFWISCEICSTVSDDSFLPSLAAVCIRCSFSCKYCNRLNFFRLCASREDFSAFFSPPLPLTTESMLAADEMRLSRSISSASNIVYFCHNDRTREIFSYLKINNFFFFLIIWLKYNGFIRNFYNFWLDQPI